MAEFGGTPHNSAKLGDIAKTVLMPGDPLRAKYIAENFLENPRLFNSVRGMLGYTGTYKGKEVSVMAHGMGIPSIGIYSYELYKFYGVENIIRIGSAGSFLPAFSIILAEKSYSDSTYGKSTYGFEENYMCSSPELNAAIIAAAEKLGKEIHVGPVTSSDCFAPYRTAERPVFAEPLLGGEMESFGLFANARHLGKKAACLLTVAEGGPVDGDRVVITAEERETRFSDMMTVALDAAISL